MQTARKADVIVMVLGDNEQTSREGWAETHLGDRSSLDLVGQQEDLARAILALGKPTVVVLLNGRPLSVNYLAAERAGAARRLVPRPGNRPRRRRRAVRPGQSRRQAAGDDRRAPSASCRSIYNRKPTARRGYLFDTTDAALSVRLRPQLHQLRYLGAALRDARDRRPASRRWSTVDVANTGSRAGDEVVQLYVRDDEASVTRPVLELRRFQRVTLAPGERRTIRFELQPDDLALWNAEMKRVVEPGTFTISAGPNSVDLKSATLTGYGVERQTPRQDTSRRALPNNPARAAA